MGRPKTDEPRSEQLNISLSLRELNSVKRRAYALGVRPTQFAREVLLNMRMASIPASERPERVHRLIHHQLGRIGNNLNQMVRHLHQTGDPLPPDLEPLLNDIRALLARVQQ